MFHLHIDLYKNHLSLGTFGWFVRTLTERKVTLRNPQLRSICLVIIFLRWQLLHYSVDELRQNYSQF